MAPATADSILNFCRFRAAEGGVTVAALGLRLVRTVFQRHAIARVSGMRRNAATIMTSDSHSGTADRPLNAIRAKNVA